MSRLTDCDDEKLCVSSCPVHYPVTAVDRYELRWWRIQNHAGVEVLEERAVYIANATWAQMFPHDEDPSGAPFEDEWMIYWRGRFTSRACGWNVFRRAGFWDWNGSYATEAEAIDVGTRLAREDIGLTEERLAKQRLMAKALVKRREMLFEGDSEVSGEPQ